MKRLSKELPTRKAIIDLGLKWQWTIGGLLAFGFLIATPRILPGGWGVDSGESIVTTIEKDPQGNTVKQVETITPSPGKSLWDGLNLLGVPLVLAVLGAWFQKSQQEQAERTTRIQREQDADETREEVLQLYFDRISALLIDNNLMAIAIQGEDALPAKKNLLEASLDVIRARTLSILRRFENDIDRKSSVIRFLAEAEIISKLNLDLNGANLNGANLEEANLNGAQLKKASLNGANLVRTQLNGAQLNGAQLYRAQLVGAQLNGAKLNLAQLEKTNLDLAQLNGAEVIGAQLNEARLNMAELNGVNLEFTQLNGAQLISAQLVGAQLQRATLIGAILYEADFYQIFFDDKTIWPAKEEVAQAKNIPIKLRQQLGLISEPPQEQSSAEPLPEEQQ